MVQFESELALHGGADGLSVVRDTLCLTPPLLARSSTGSGRSSGSSGSSGSSTGSSGVAPLAQPTAPLLWMEVSHAHPRVIEQLVRAGAFRGSDSSRGNSGSGGSGSRAESEAAVAAAPAPLEEQWQYEFREGLADLFGQPRFVKLAAVSSSSSSSSSSSRAVAGAVAVGPVS